MTFYSELIDLPHAYYIIQQKETENERLAADLMSHVKMVGDQAQKIDTLQQRFCLELDAYAKDSDMAALRAEIERLQAAKRRALAVADERAKESVGLRAENERLRAALRRSTTAVDDWLNIYAAEHCDEERVHEAQARVYEYGTVAYIAGVQEQAYAALGINQQQMKKEV